MGYVMLQTVATNPETWLGYGTWTQVAQGLLLIGQTGGQTGGQQVGSSTHSHAFTQPGAHSDHAAMTHAGATVADHTNVLNHVHVQQLQGGTTGTTTGTHLMGSAATGGSLRSSAQSTLNPTSGGVAAMAHTVGQASQHAALSHSAHAGGAVTDGTNAPPSFVAYIFQRTA